MSTTPASNAKSSSIIILGIDPGTVVMGISVIEVKKQNITLLHLSTINMHWQRDMFERLRQIYVTLDETIRQYKPSQLAIEAPFFGKNVQSMLKLGRSQGVAITCALQHQLEIFEYSPKKIKQVITGNGNADKERVWYMLQKTLGFTEKPKGYDASDALAVAVCHHYQCQSPLPAAAKMKGWEAFIKNNPDRIKG